MIKQLSIHRLLSFLFLCLAWNTLSAQPVTITTNYTTPGLGQTLLINTTTPTMYITFKVYNNRTKPIILREVGNWHVGAGGNFGNPAFPFNSNGKTYALWYKKNATGNPTPITPQNGWALAKAGNPIFTTSNAITPVIQDINLIICPDTFFYFALVSDTISAANANAPQTPATFTSSNVTLEGFVSPSPWWGSYPSTATQQANVAFRGSITFDTVLDAPPPPIIKADPIAVCAGDSTVLTAELPEFAKCAFPNPIFTWTWATGTATGATIKVQVNETLQYNCTVTSGGKESAPASVKVVAVKPEPPVVSGKFAYCVGEQFELLEVLADTFDWFYVDTLGSPLPTVPTINTNLGPQKDTFYVARWEDGCYSPERTMVVLSAATRPVKPIVTSPLYYCEGHPAPPLEAIGNNLIWYYFPTGGIPTTIPPTPPTSVRNKFDYYVANTNDGCEGPREHIEVFVEFKPNGMIVTSRDRLCQGDTITVEYYGSAYDSLAFKWQIRGSSGISADSLQRKGPYVVQFDSAGVHTITVQAGSGDCLSDVYVQEYEVDSTPYAVITAREQVCQGNMELVSLEYYDETIDSFKWDFGAGGRTTHYATDQGPYGVIWDEYGERVIALTLVQGSCAATVYDTVEVRPYPDARILIDNPSGSDLYCAGDSIRLRAYTISSGSEYMWGPNRYFDIYGNLPAAYAIVDFTSYVTLAVEDQFGCKNTDSILIKTEPCCKLTFPTAFSPNNDGKNDFFHLLNVTELDNYYRTNSLNYDVRTFRVMNRWGVTVFESANEIRGWDGKFNGEPQDMGTYYWFISYMCGGKQMDEKGEVLLVR